MLSTNYKQQTKKLHSAQVLDYIGMVLSSPMPRGRETLTYRKPPQYIEEAIIDGKFHIVFIGYYPHPALIKKALVLRQTGRYYSTFIACCIREETNIYQYFDQVYEVEDYKELSCLLSNSNSWAYNVMSHPIILPTLVLANIKTGRVIIDINDCLFYSEFDLESLECKLEREVFKHADILIHTMPKEAMDKVCNVWSINTPHRTVHCLPVPSLFEEGKEQINHQVKLVLTGGLMPYDLAIQRGCENHIIDTLIRSLSRINISLTCYLNQNARNMYWEEHKHYIDMDSSNAFFSFKKGLPYHRLPREIKSYDYGIIYENVQTSKVSKDHFTYNMATKIFSYMEAGLPVLIHDESSYMAEYTDKYGIGIVYPAGRIDEIPELLERADYKQLKENVRNFRASNSINRIIPDIEWAYDTKQAINGG